MAKTLKDIQAKINILTKEADALLAKEAAGVIGRIRDAVAHYNLTPDDIFGKKAATAKKAGPKGAPKAGAKKPPAPPKYHDGAGHMWTGRGKRPNWFKDAIAGGKTAQDLEIRN